MSLVEQGPVDVPGGAHVSLGLITGPGCTNGT